MTTAHPALPAGHDGEAVAWQWRQRYKDSWLEWCGVTKDVAFSYLAEISAGRKDVEVRSLYASPPPVSGPTRAEVIAGLKAAHANFMAHGRDRESDERYKDMADTVRNLYVSASPVSGDVRAATIEECGNEAHKIVEIYEAKAIELFKKSGEWEARASRDTAELIESNIRALSPSGEKP